MVRWTCSVSLEEYHEGMFTVSNIAMVGSSRKNRRESCHSTSRKFVVGNNLAKNNREKHGISWPQMIIEREKLSKELGKYRRGWWLKIHLTKIQKSLMVEKPFNLWKNGKHGSWTKYDVQEWWWPS